MGKMLRRTAASSSSCLYFGFASSGFGVFGSWFGFVVYLRGGGYWRDGWWMDLGGGGGVWDGVGRRGGGWGLRGGGGSGGG